jgi:ubiquinone/menaquinone biosynthesis C-methylase UbiE
MCAELREPGRQPPGPLPGQAELRLTRRVANVDLGMLEVGRGDRIVDVGCGEGALAALMAGAGLIVVGVEPAEYLRQAFNARLAGVDPRCRALPGTAACLPFADGELGAVVMTEVLEHVPDPKVAMTELRRVLRPGGMLCLSVPTSYTELVFWRLHPRYADNATHERIFTKPELRRLIERSGFRIERWEGRNFLPALSWIFHALLRSDADHTGAIKQHLFIDRGLGALWRLLGLLRVAPLLERIGNRVWAKSWYVYCRAV